MVATILISGNLGYVGSPVIRSLREAFPFVRLVGLDIGYFGGASLAQGMLADALLDKQLYADLRDESCYRELAPDIVIHLAAISNDPIGSAYASQTVEINQTASLTFAKKMKENGCKHFIFASSCSLYGDIGNELPIGEDGTLRPLTEYAKSKAYMERELTELCDSKFQVTCLRFATACGPSSRIRFDLVLNDFVLSAMTSQVIRISGDGSPWRPLIDVRDMALAITLCCKSEYVREDLLIANVGRLSSNYRVSELAALVSEMIPGSDVEILNQNRNDPRSYKVDFTTFNALFPEFEKSSISIEESIIELKGFISTHGLVIEDLQKYKRLNMLSQLVDCGVLSRDLRLVGGMSESSRY